MAFDALCSRSATVRHGELNVWPNENSAAEQPGTQVLPDVAPPKHKKAPLYHVILHDDDTHTYHYVIAMLMRLFGKDPERAFQHACEVDKNGVTIVETTTLERAELKRDQIKAFGPDPLLENSKGSMYATIEPAD